MMHHASLPKKIRSNVHSRAAALSALMELSCGSIASSSFTPKKFSFLLDDYQSHSVTLTCVDRDLYQSR